MIGLTVKWQAPGDISANFLKALENGKKAFYDAAMDAVIGDITRGIDSGVGVDGKPFPALEPSTIYRKGHSQPLIDKGLLRQKFTYSKLNQSRMDKSEIGIKPLSKKGDTPRNEVGTYLQIDGIRSKKGVKHFTFFGISRDAEKEINGYMEILIQNALEYAAIS